MCPHRFAPAKMSRAPNAILDYIGDSYMNRSTCPVRFGKNDSVSSQLCSPIIDGKVSIGDSEYELTNKPKNAKGVAGFNITGNRAAGLYFTEAQGMKKVPKFTFLPLFDRTTMSAVPDGDPLSQPVGRYPIYRFSNGACDLFNSFLDVC